MKTQTGFNSRSMGINDGESYYPFEIERWCRHTLKNPLCSSDEKFAASVIYGDYFVNPIGSLNVKARYYMKKGRTDDEYFLYRDRNPDGVYRIISNSRYCDMELTGKEKELLEKIFDKLYISASISKL